MTSGALLDITNYDILKPFLRTSIVGPDILCNYGGKDAELKKHCEILIFELFEEMVSMNEKKQHPTFRFVEFQYVKYILTGDGAVTHLLAGHKGPGSTRRAAPNLAKEEFLGHTWRQPKKYVFTLGECAAEKKREEIQQNELKKQGVEICVHDFVFNKSILLEDKLEIYPQLTKVLVAPPVLHAVCMIPDLCLKLTELIVDNQSKEYKHMIYEMSRGMEFNAKGEMVTGAQCILKQFYKYAFSFPSIVKPQYCRLSFNCFVCVCIFF